MKKIKKALLVTTVSGFVPQFEMSNVQILQSMGYEIHYASNFHTPSYGSDNHRLEGTGIIQHQIDFVRSPFHLQNIKVFKQLKQLMMAEQFSLVHCHTPMGGVMARLAARSTKTGPVIYTAHGFHFYTGASIINWLFYYPIEKFLSYFTDEQICINKEDYERAKQHFHANHVSYIPGVGLDFNKIKKTVDVTNKKIELGLPLDKIILLSSGELIKRKNHETVIRAIAKLKNDTSLFYDKIHYVICGQGELAQHLKQLSDKLDITESVSFLGYREDMMDIFQIADIFLFPSFQEGLPVALLEAMAYGLPVICSDIRGSNDLLGGNARKSMGFCDGGIMIKRANDVPTYSQAISYMIKNKNILHAMGEKNSERTKYFSSENVKNTMKNIYVKY
uniref:glycosyltransferase family 4 protein n=1 Tax=Clostridium sp. 12(A) TaxID=1163671 RepID=UPI0004B9D02C|nr:glycosyltransferase family 4 protein [Clostridium sp. 12(A)]